VSGKDESIVPMDVKSLSKQLTGRVVAEFAQPSPDSIALRFIDGSTLVVQPQDDGISVTLSVAEASRATAGSGPRPTRRQMEYLEFIKKYMHRYGVSPAETDIQAHFLVSAPSVNQMVRTLERRKLIARSRDWLGKTVPRSIRVIWDE